MGCTEQLVENISGYSKAKYSTWLFYRPDRLLFDAGEGVSTSLGNYIYGIEQIFLSHGHFDHIGGVPGILRSRLSSRGDKEKPIQIFYPDGCRPVEELRRYLDDSIDFRNFEVIWQTVEDGQQIEMRTGGQHRSMLAFRTRHIRGQLTLGYALVENRKRRKLEFADLTEEELRRLATEKKVSLMEPYQARLLVFSGDAMPLDADNVADAELLIHDTTFLDVRDRERNTHATFGEAVDLALSGRCGGLLAFHVSSRYTVRELRRCIENAQARLTAELPIWYLDFKAGLRRDPVFMDAGRASRVAAEGEHPGGDGGAEPRRIHEGGSAS